LGGASKVTENTLVHRGGKRGTRKDPGVARPNE